MNRTTIKLADGRQLIYYDAEPGKDRSAVDRRVLPPVSTSSEVRYDPLLDSWTIVASHRQNRIYLPSAQDCPFCPTRDGHLTEIPADDYDVVVLENRFPSLFGDQVLDHGAGPAGGSEWRQPGSGRCEVVCFTSKHDASFSSLSPGRAALVLEAWTQRSAELSELPAVEQVFCFENRGAEIGVTQTHPHGQIYAYPFVTPRTHRMIASATSYRDRTGRNLFDDRLAREQHGERVVASSPSWTAFVPFAARWPYEVHLYPNRPAPDLLALDDEARSEFADLYLDLLGRFDRLFDRPAPYISAWHQAPTRTGRELFACHLELFTIRRTDDKLKYLAGSESAMEAFANDIAPEAAAQRLRELAS
ncbi:MAG: galactose-phosphate uridylyltransferase [Acidimicrobiaceae bacterium]|nr:galactose-phosphate uridylyltransferase [Acidimicrobiaceae bacterium]